MKALAFGVGSALLLAGCSSNPSDTEAASPEVRRGEKTFTLVCSSCHVISNVNHVGPGLKGVIGRNVGTNPGYDYSDALRQDRKQIWSASRIESYLQGPLNMYPKGRMAITPLTPQQAKEVVAYISYRQAYGGDAE